MKKTALRKSTRHEKVSSIYQFSNSVSNLTKSLNDIETTMHLEVDKFLKFQKSKEYKSYAKTAVHLLEQFQVMGLPTMLAGGAAHALMTQSSRVEDLDFFVTLPYGTKLEATVVKAAEKTIERIAKELNITFTHVKPTNDNYSTKRIIEVYESHFQLTIDDKPIKIQIMFQPMGCGIHQFPDSTSEISLKVSPEKDKVIVKYSPFYVYSHEQKFILLKDGEDFDCSPKRLEKIKEKFKDYPVIRLTGGYSAVLNREFIRKMLTEVVKRS